MSVLQEILTWSTSLPLWQSDAIRRLFVNADLSDEDMDDLFALLKSEHGIPDPKGRAPVQLDAADIPVAAAPGIKVTLRALKDLRNVNRIADKQRLPFCPTGMTVIYGDNGSGKSGYSRVLKRACRARDQREPIHPDVFLAPNDTGKAEATFEVEVNGTPAEVKWVNGTATDPVLSSLAVFDARCARSYLDEEGDFAYVPYGLDILEGLAGACRKLKGRIEEERGQNLVDKTPFEDLKGATAVGELLAALSPNTPPTQVEALAAVTQADLARREQLVMSLMETKPEEKATQLRLRASRISKIVEAATQKLTVVDDRAVTELRGLVDAYRVAREAAELAAQALKGDASLLPGTGGEAWKELFEAARKFCVEAYPALPFPEFGPDDQCPLCQQPLGEASERLKRFEEFITQETEETAKTRRRLLAVRQEAFIGPSVSLGLDDETLEELKSLDNDLAEATKAFGAALATRYAAIRVAMDSGGWDQLVALPSSPSAQLTSLAEKLNKEAATLSGLADPIARAALQAELGELEARFRLAKVKGSVLTAIERLNRQARLAECAAAVKTNAISLKTADLTEKVVCKTLEGALNCEFKALGVGGLQVCLKSHADKGKAYHKLTLNLPQAKTPAEILSEGEQRAIAIGSFLAEVGIGGSLGGIVFDDPVSSLDHKHRERVARRLAQEAAKRQVMVFTHDLYFLSLLVEEAQRAKVPIETRSVAPRAQGYGVVDPDLPFEGMNTRARVGYLRNKQAEIKKVFQSGDQLIYRKLTAEAYRELRLAWERAVEEVLLNSVVLRFRKGIETKRLARVAVEDPDYATVEHWMSRCSNFAHDQALLGGVEVPSPDELLADIDALDKWRTEILGRAEETRKRRE